MHPIKRHRMLAGRRLRLGNFVLVVWENEVGRPTMDVKLFAEVVLAHGGALDMPARPARSPWAIPRRLARLGLFPKGEVERIALFFAHRNTLAGAELIEITPAQGAVAWIFGDRKINAVARFVRGVQLD